MKHLFVFLYALLALPFVSAAEEEVTPAIARYEQMAVQSPEKGTAFDRIYQFYLSGPGLEALAHRWKAAADKHEANEVSYLILQGILADRRGRTAEARTFYEQATKAQPTNSRIWIALGQLESSDGKLPAAIHAYEQALTNNPDAATRADLYCQLARAKQRNLDDAGARETWKKLLSEFSEDSFALEEAGAAFLNAEDFDDAKAAFEKLGLLSEENSYGRVQSMIKLAEVSERQGKYADALQQYEAALPKTSEASWQNRDLRARIEQIYRRQDDLPGLITYYQKWLEKNPSDVEAELRLANLHEELGRKEEALACLKKAIALSPDRKEIKASLVSRLLDNGKYAEAVEAARELTEADPSDQHYWELLGEAQWKSQQPPTAESKAATLASWRKIAPADSKQVRPILQLAEIFRAHSLDDEALAEYRRALDLSPDINETRLRAVDYLMSVKREKEAEALLAGLVEGSRATPENYARLASAWERYEKSDRAADAIGKGLAIAPTNFDLLKLRWDLFAAGEKWDDALAMFDALAASAPNLYTLAQIESTFAQLLKTANKADTYAKPLVDKITAGTALTEGEFRVLLRLQEIQNATDDWEKTMVAARQQFPKSPSLLRLKIDHERKAGDFENSVADLKLLAELAPEQKTDLLAELARVQQDWGKPDEALATVRQIIELSPANTTGYLLQADLALASNQEEIAIAGLKDAIRLADKPNDIRLRLARIYQEQGNSKDARTLLNEAFESTETPQEKLGLMRPLTEAYYQDGQLDELIGNLRQKQKGEEGGWRYGLYLAEVFQQLQDFGAARRELALSLAARPNDENLLRQLVALAEKEEDNEDVLRYRQMLATVDPSEKTQISLALQYAKMNRLAEAWEILKNNSASVGRNPGGWKDVLIAFKKSEYSDRVLGLVKQVITPKDASGNVAMGELLMTQNDFEGAEKALWSVVFAPIPAETKPAPAAAGRTGLSMQIPPFYQRYSQAYQFQNAAQQLLSDSPSQYSRSGMITSPFPQSATSTSQALAMRDRALVYLSVLALQQNKAAEFLTAIQKKFDELKLEPKERLLSYQIIGARDNLWEEIERLATAESSDSDTDQICLTVLSQMTAERAVSPEKQKRASELQALFNKRIASNPKSPNIAKRIANQQAYVEAMRSGDKDKMKEAVSKMIADFDLKNPSELFSAIALSAQTGDYKNADILLDQLQALKKQFASQQQQPGMMSAWQQTQYLSYSLLRRTPNGTAEKNNDPALIALMAKAMRMSYPDTPPRSSLGASTSTMRYSDDTGGLYPTRYFDAQRLQVLQQFYQMLSSQGMFDSYMQALAKQEGDLQDWQKIYPALTRLYFEWWSGDKAKAEKTAADLLAAQPSDEFRLTLAAMLLQDEKYDEATKLLQEVRAKFGPEYIFAQKQLLKAAKMAKNTELAKTVALRLVALHLPANDRNMLMQDLRSLGLTQKADELSKKQSATSPSRQNFEVNRQLINSMNAALTKKDTTQAVSLAKQILARDPMPTQQNFDQGSRQQAIRCLDTAKQLDAYVQDLQKQLATEPNSLRLNLLLGEATDLDKSDRKDFGVQMPVWLKITRRGSNLEQLISYDGETWTNVAQSTINFPAKTYVGVMTSSLNQKLTSNAIFDHVSVKAAAPAAAQTWQAADIGTFAQKGAFEQQPDGGLRLTSQGGNMGTDSDHCNFAYQLLDGDGEIVARLASFDSPHVWAKAGVMIRDSLDATAARLAFTVAKPRGVMQIVRKTANGANDHPLFGTYYPGTWFKIERKGSEFISSASADGKTWTEIARRTMDWGKTICAGVLSGCHASGQGSEAVWEDLHIEKGGSLVAQGEWASLDLENTSAPGYARFKDGKLEIGSPQDTQRSNIQRFFYQALEGDGAIVGRLANFSGKKDDWSGLAVRESAKATSPEITLEMKPDHYLASWWRTGGAGQSLRYYQKVVELSPRNLKLQMRLAQQLAGTGEEDAAADIISKVLPQDIGALDSMNLEKIVAVYDHTKRTEELVKAIEAWNPPPASPYGGGNNKAYLLGEFARRFMESNQLDAAIRIYRKAAQGDGYDSARMRTALVGVLIKAGEKEDAVKTIGDALFPTAKAPQTPALGQPLGYSRGTSLLNNVSWSGSGEIYSPILDLLHQAVALGVAEDLIKRCSLEMKANPSNSELPLIQLLIQIVARDPSYRVAVNTILEKGTLGSRENSGMTIDLFNNGMITLLAGELATWPSEREVALKLSETAITKSGQNAQSFQRIVALKQFVDITEDVGELVAIKAALKQQADFTQSGLVTGQSPFGTEGAMDTINKLLVYGMLPEATKLISAAKETNSYKSGSRDQVDALAADAQWLTQQQGQPAIVAALAPGKAKDGKRTVYWEINAGDLKPRSSFEAPTYLRAGIPVKLKGYDLEILAGPNKEELKRVTTLKGIASGGSLLVSLPDTVTCLQAVLTAPTLGADGKPAASQKVQSEIVLVGKPDNLLADPNFTATGKTPTQSPWQSTLGFQTRLRTIGGSLRIEAVRLIGNNSQSQYIVGQRIQIDPAKSYILSAWMRYSQGNGRLGMRMLNADGKILNTFMFESRSSSNWCFSQARLNSPQTPQLNNTPGMAIPAGAVYFEPVFTITGKCEFANLSLSEAR